MTQSLLLSVFCVVAATRDIRTGKVPNKLLRLALGMIGAFIAINSIVRGSWPWNEDNQSFRYFLNIFIGCAVSIGLYTADIWAPGDAKLFIVILILYPPTLRTANENATFPALQIIIWTFAIGYIYLLFEAVFMHRTEKSTVHMPRNKISRTDVISMGLSIIAVYSFTFFANLIIISFIPVYYEANRSLVSLVLIGGSMLIGKIYWWGKIAIATVSASGSYILLPAFQQPITLPFHYLFPIFVAILAGVSSRIIKKDNYQEIVPDALRPGMILSMFTACRLLNSKIPGLPNKKTETRKSKLNPQEVEAVRLWALKKKEAIIIVRMLPFAPFIAAGTILEIIFGWLLHFW